MNSAATQTAFTKENGTNSYAYRDHLITEHLSLVNVIAAQVQRSLPVHTEIDDLVHAGTLGLFEAATKYQESKEVAFSTYAKFRIKGAILDSLRQIDWASRDLRKRHKQMEAVTRSLTEKLGRTPAQEEIAEAMGLTFKRFLALLADFRGLSQAAAQAHLGEREDQLQPEAPAPASDAPDHVFARAELRDKLKLAVASLPKRYQEVVNLYYTRDLTMKEIGIRLGVNESRISQIHKNALERMQTALGTHGVSSLQAIAA